MIRKNAYHWKIYCITSGYMHTPMCFTCTIWDIDSGISIQTIIAKWDFTGLMPKIHDVHVSAHLVLGEGFPVMLNTNQEVTCPIYGKESKIFIRVCEKL